MRKCFILLVAAVVVAAWVLPAMAQEKQVTVYGSTRVQTFNKNDSQERAGRGGLLSHNYTDVEMGGLSSNFGARFKSGNTSANVEIRPYAEGGEQNASTTGNMRYWWGQVDFGNVSLRAGQQGVVAGLFPPGCCVDDGSVQSSFGAWSGTVRDVGVTLTSPMGAGTLSAGFFAIETRRAGATWAAQTAANYPAATWGTSTDKRIPKLEISYEMNLGAVSFKAIGGYNKYDEVAYNAFGGERTWAITSWVAGAQMLANAGPLTFMVQGHYAQNPDPYVSVGPTRSLAAVYETSTDGVTDVKEIGFFTRILYKMSDLVTWEAGGGYMELTRDRPSLAKEKDPQAYYYINASIFLSKTFRLVPEIGYFDYQTSTNSLGVKSDDGNQLYWGAYWRIDF